MDGQTSASVGMGTTQFSLGQTTYLARPDWTHFLDQGCSRNFVPGKQVEEHHFSTLRLGRVIRSGMWELYKVLLVCIWQKPMEVCKEPQPANHRKQHTLPRDCALLQANIDKVFPSPV